MAIATASVAVAAALVAPWLRISRLSQQNSASDSMVNPLIPLTVDITTMFSSLITWGGGGRIQITHLCILLL